LQAPNEQVVTQIEQPKEPVINTNIQNTEDIAIATESAPEVQENTKRSTKNRPERTKKPKKLFSKIKKGLGIKSKKKDIKEVVQLSEQLEQNEKFQEPEERKLILEERENESVISSPEIKKMKELKVIEERKPSDIVNDVAVMESAPAIIYKEEKGLAIWNQTSSNSKNLFALHPTAKVGSYIEITNPMMNKTVQAKVIGNIPPRTYTDEISIVVSPRVAKMLGVVDKRFKVRMKYQAN
jgi:hypothetical protein